MAYGDGGDTIYYRIRGNDGSVWNGTSMVNYVVGDVGDYDLPMTDEGGGFYIADFPLDVPAGEYALVSHIQLGVSPADGDDVIGELKINWDGEYITDNASSQELQDALSNLAVLIGLAIEAGKSTLFLSSSEAN